MSHTKLQYKRHLCLSRITSARHARGSVDLRLRPLFFFFWSFVPISLITHKGPGGWLHYTASYPRPIVLQMCAALQGREMPVCLEILDSSRRQKKHLASTKQVLFINDVTQEKMQAIVCGLRCFIQVIVINTGVGYRPESGSVSFLYPTLRLQKLAAAGRFRARGKSGNSSNTPDG